MEGSSQRDHVARALAPRDWTCARCGAGNEATERRCTTCGAERVARVRRFERGRRPVLITAAALAALGVAGAVVVPGLREDADRERRAEQARLAASVEAERERLTADAVPHAARLPRALPREDPLAHRERSRAVIERRISADARERVGAGTMEGPVAGTSCSPYPRTQTRASAEDDPSLAVARYQCIAFKRRIQLPEVEGEVRTGLIGQPFWAVADYRRGRVTWCKVTPRAGEGGKVLAFVPVPEPCRDPAGPG